MEIQQKTGNNENVVANLFVNELPKAMLRAVREWTKGHSILLAVKVGSPDNGWNLVMVSNEKQWATRAIQEGITLLIDDELVDFISAVKDGTCAYFKIRENEINKKSGKTFFYMRREYSSTLTLLETRYQHWEKASTVCSFQFWSTNSAGQFANKFGW